MFISSIKTLQRSFQYSSVILSGSRKQTASITNVIKYYNPAAISLGTTHHTREISTNSTGGNKSLVNGNSSNSNSNTVDSKISGVRTISMSVPKAQKNELNITFVRANGERIKAKGKVGDTLLDVIVNNNVDLDGFGACEGTLTCSTCHLIFKPEDYAKLGDKPSDEEADMLDLAYELTDTSRLGCQITLTEDLDNLEVQVPSTVNDARTTP